MKSLDKKSQLLLFEHTFLLLILMTFTISVVNYSYFSDVNVLDFLIKLMFLFAIAGCYLFECKPISKLDAYFVKILLFSLGLIIFVAAVNDWKILFSFRVEIYSHALLLLVLFKVFELIDFDEGSFWRLLSLFSLIIFAIALTAYLNNIPRAGLLVDNINTYGKVTALIGLVFIIKLMSYKYHSTRQLVLDVVIVLILLFALFISGTRAAWIGLPAVLVLLLTLFLKHMPRNQKRLIFGMMLSLLLLLVFFWSPIFQKFESGFIGVLKYYDGNIHSSWGYRLEMWRIAFMGFKENPWIGSGLDSFNEYIMYLKNQDLTQLPANFGSPHNEYLHMLFSLGFLGFLALVFMFIALWALLVKTVGSFNAIPKSTLAMSFLGLLMFVWVTSLFDTSWSQKRLIYVYVTVLIMTFYLIQKEKNKRKEYVQ